ncbi:MAG: molecular chaperone TorD family protein [candidate division Zixibacteria bacterium]|nr:molecular chaperone TorD family protein [candidate division Zixibacteria bacterium]MDH3939198.1 molecular chaperone TorD family protein [candidate division Zixibacteria bacterium]MDH4034474.1 molecular chaperone TorD family protein [candidate division Zixibacteria bacterium]
MQLENSRKLKQQRTDCYRLLAALFYPPQREVLLSESVCQNLALLLDAVCPEAGRYAGEMLQCLEKSSDSELAVEHAALFVGPFELKAPPYGSVYLEEHRRVLGETTMATLAMYREAGLKLDIREPADHIAVELEFMYFLAVREVEALLSEDQGRPDVWQKRQAEFLLGYLGRWTPDFCSSIKNGTQNEYYRALANCLAAFIACECEKVKQPANAGSRSE